MIRSKISGGHTLRIAFGITILAIILLASNVCAAYTEVQLTMSPADETLGVFSPDGTKIAFVSGASGSNEIWVMNTDGSGQTKLTSLGSASDPAWSPDGKEIVFDRNGDIWKVSADGSVLTQLTSTDYPYEQTPFYSPNGQKILYTKGFGGWYEVWVMNSDGTSQTSLATEHGQDTFAIWSPDGSKISYTYGSDFNQPLSLALMNPDGTGKQTIVSFPMTYGFSQAWSPDSSKIVFSASSSTTQPYDRGVYIINMDGSGLTKIANGDIMWQTQSWYNQVWSPDGSKIVYSSKDSGNYDVWIMNPDGSGKEQLTTSSGDDYRPIFSPDGKRVLFSSNRNGNWDIYEVLLNYNFNGFFQPIDNLPTLNSVKAGSAVPVKFSLGGYQGLDIFATGYPTSHSIDCASNVPIDAVEDTVMDSASHLSYDATSDQYNYIWKTDKAWTGTCRQLVVQLKDGTYHYADFKFLK